MLFRCLDTIWTPKPEIANIGHHERCCLGSLFLFIPLHRQAVRSVPHRYPEAAFGLKTEYCP